MAYEKQQSRFAESEEYKDTLKCRWKSDGAGKTVTVKKHGFVTRFDMEDVPGLIVKLAKFYMSTGGLGSKLPYLEKVIHESRRRYMQALKTRSDQNEELLNELETHVNDFTKQEMATWSDTDLSTANDTDKELEQARKLSGFSIVSTGDTVRKSYRYHDMFQLECGMPMDCSNKGKMAFAKSLDDERAKILSEIKNKKPEDCVNQIQKVRSLEGRRDRVVSQLVDYKFPVIQLSSLDLKVESANSEFVDALSADDTRHIESEINNSGSSQAPNTESKIQRSSEGDTNHEICATNTKRATMNQYRTRWSTAHKARPALKQKLETIFEDNLDEVEGLNTGREDYDSIYRDDEWVFN